MTKVYVLTEEPGKIASSMANMLVDRLKSCINMGLVWDVGLDATIERRLNRFIVEDVREPRGGEVTDITVNLQEPDAPAVEEGEGTSPMAVTLNGIIREIWEQAIANDMRITKEGLICDYHSPKAECAPQAQTNALQDAMDRDVAATRIKLRSRNINAPLPHVKQFNVFMNDLVMNQTVTDRKDFEARITRQLCRQFARSAVDSGIWILMQVVQLTGFTMEEWWGQYSSRQPIERTSEPSEPHAIAASIRRVLNWLDERKGPMSYEQFEAKFLYRIRNEEHWHEAFTNEQWLSLVEIQTQNSLVSHYHNWDSRP